MYINMYTKERAREQRKHFRIDQRKRLHANIRSRLWIAYSSHMPHLLNPNKPRTRSRYTLNPKPNSLHPGPSTERVSCVSRRPQGALPCPDTSARIYAKLVRQRSYCSNYCWCWCSYFCYCSYNSAGRNPSNVIESR